MSQVKYKHFYFLMVQHNKALFDQFAIIHKGFVADPEKWQHQFNEVGREIKDIMRDWERRLCSGTERGNYGQYSGKLAEKFWNEIKNDFPLIDQVGIIKTILPHKQ